MIYLPTYYLLRRGLSGTSKAAERWIGLADQIQAITSELELCGHYSSLTGNLKRARQRAHTG